jgi:hypothetical protein
MSNILPIILIVASVGMFFTYINPTYTGVTGSSDNSAKSIQELQTTKADYDDALNKTRELEIIRDNLLTKLNALGGSEKEGRIAKVLPDNIDSVRLIIDIDNIAAKYGMSLSKLVLTASGDIPKNQTALSMPPPDYGAPIMGPVDAAYNSIKLGFSVSGTYENFNLFLKELEESLRIVDVVSLSFSTGRTTTTSASPSQSPTSLALLNASGMYTYNVTIRTYYLK